MEHPVMPGNTSPETKQNATDQNPKKKDSFLGYMVVALGLALFIRFFVAAPFIVSGASMEPGFENLHYLIVDRVSYEFEGPQRGDVIVFDLPQEEDRSLIKRVIGLPGETILVRSNTVTIVNEENPRGFVLEEPYLDPANLGGESNVQTILGEDELFVLGDNRRVSADSRLWGTLPLDHIVGRVFLRLYPFSQISIFPGEARYAE